MAREEYNRKPARLERREEQPEVQPAAEPAPAVSPSNSVSQARAVGFDHFAYLSIVAWPKDINLPNRIVEVVKTGLADTHTAAIVSRREPPCVLGVFERTAAADAAEKLEAAGCNAFAFSLADLAAFGPTLKIRDLRVVDGNLDVDIWRGPSTTIRRQTIELLVRGSIKPNDEKFRRQRVADRVHNIVDDSPALAGTGAYSDPVTNFTIRRLIDPPGTPSSFIQVGEKLDIHTRDGSIYQVDGNKFAFDALGDLKGHADRANMDRLCDLIAHICPNEIVDQYFSAFQPPAHCARLFRVVPGMGQNGENPAFAFYSRWKSLLHRRTKKNDRR